MLIIIMMMIMMTMMMMMMMMMVMMMMMMVMMIVIVVTKLLSDFAISIHQCKIHQQREGKRAAPKEGADTVELMSRVP